MLFAGFRRTAIKVGTPAIRVVIRRALFSSDRQVERTLPPVTIIQNRRAPLYVIYYLYSPPCRPSGSLPAPGQLVFTPRIHSVPP